MLGSSGVLEGLRRLTCSTETKVIKPPPAFRLFSTANPVGLGDTLRPYHGTRRSTGSDDRWSIVTTLN